MNVPGGLVKVPDWLVNTLVIAVTLAWLASITASLFVPSYEAPGAINLAFSSIVGGVLLAKGRTGEEVPPDDQRHGNT